MATDVVSNEPAYLLPVELHPVVDHLVTEDDTPVDNIFSEKQQRLLTEPLHSSWAGPGRQRSFVAMSNVGLFFTVRRRPLVPDALLSVGVELPADIRAKSHRSYFIWEYGKAPDVVIEVVSNREGDEDTGKLAVYAEFAVPYYVIFDPDRVLGAEALRAYRLDIDAQEYRTMAGPVSFPKIGLGLRLWQGRYEDLDATWLRWVDAEGTPVPTGRERADAERQLAESERLRADTERQLAESERQRADTERQRAESERQRADAERQRAESERQRADAERQRADRLAEQLRQFGVEPPGA
jgi:Uma2 family endonuclease